jgi:hypothetical protein
MLDGLLFGLSFAALPPAALHHLLALQTIVILSQPPLKRLAKEQLEVSLKIQYYPTFEHFYLRRCCICRLSQTPATRSA